MIQLITAVGSIASQWLSNKAEKSKAIQAKELELIEQGGNWEALHAQGSQDSYKDEYWTLIFSLPLLAIFYGVFSGSIEVIEQVRYSFEVLESLPDWYQYLLFMLVSASVGIRGADKLIKLKRGVNEKM